MQDHRHTRTTWTRATAGTDAQIPCSVKCGAPPGGDEAPVRSPAWTHAPNDIDERNESRFLADQEVRHPCVYAPRTRAEPRRDWAYCVRTVDPCNTPQHAAQRSLVHRRTHPYHD